MILLVVGLGLILASFLFALFNMGGLVSKPDGWERGFKKHLACIGGLAIGGVLTFAGLVQLVFSLLNQ